MQGTTWRGSALILGFGDQPHRASIPQRALRHTAAIVKEYAEQGILMFYGPRLADQYRLAGVYIDKILKGTAPADLPIEEPTKFELVINMKTAKALGRLPIPQSLLLRADRVIE